MSTRPRRGFALLVALWVVAGLSVLGLGIRLAARNAIAAAHNRSDLTRARWRAEECAEQAQMVLSAELARRGWGSLSEVVRSASASTSDCRVMLRASGARLDLNRADPPMLDALFARLGFAAGRRDSMVDALLDWRDADDLPRPFGAERRWYEAEGRLSPRNGAFGDVRELRRVRGFERVDGLDSLFDVEPGRVALDFAPIAVIAALPGFGDEAVSRIADLRVRGLAVGDLLSFSGQLSTAARRQLTASYPELVSRTTTEPDAWVLVARATIGQPPVSAVLELRLVPAGERAAIVRRRTWVE